MKMTMKFAFYQVCLTSKYNRIAPGDDQLTDFKFHFGIVQIIVFLISSAARIVFNLFGVKKEVFSPNYIEILKRLWFPVFIIYKYIPELPREPIKFEMHVLSTTAGIEYGTATLRDFDANVLEYDFTKKWPETLHFGSEAWEPKFYMLGPLYYIAMKLESKNEKNQIRNQFCERFTIQRINDEKGRPGGEILLYSKCFFFNFCSVPTWICAVPQREKKVKTIFSSDLLKINETSKIPLWSLNCQDDYTECTKRKG